MLQWRNSCTSAAAVHSLWHHNRLWDARAKQCHHLMTIPRILTSTNHVSCCTNVVVTTTVQKLLRLSTQSHCTNRSYENHQPSSATTLSIHGINQQVVGINQQVVGHTGHIATTSPHKVLLIDHSLQPPTHQSKPACQHARRPLAETRHRCSSHICHGATSGSCTMPCSRTVCSAQSVKSRSTSAADPSPPGMTQPAQTSRTNSDNQ